MLLRGFRKNLFAWNFATIVVRQPATANFLGDNLSEMEGFCGQVKGAERNLKAAYFHKQKIGIKTSG